MKIGLQLVRWFMVACLAYSGAVAAGTNGFFVPFFRGSSNSASGYWESFSAPVGSPNRPDRPGATTGAVLMQSDTNAFLTGSGNIYNLSGVSAFELSDSATFSLGTVVLQVRSLGGGIDPGSLLLACTNASGPHALAPLSRVELHRGNQPGLGATVSSLWQWDLSALGVTSYSVSFRAAGASLSFDALTLDTWARFAPLFTTPFGVRDIAPAIERWMYAFNAAPCDRPAGSVFGTFGDEAGVDTRHAQLLLGWDTAATIPTNRGPARYLVNRCRVMLTINRGGLFVYDPTQDDFRTYFATNHPSYLPDHDEGRPMELFGAGFRNGFDAASFDACAPFGTNTPGGRNAFAAGWSARGALVDVSNNVGKTNEAFPSFEVAPFAIGRTTNAVPGQLVPAGTKVIFDLNLADPFVLAYVRDGLNGGRLRYMASSLHGGGSQFGSPGYPDFATRFNEAVLSPTLLELDGVVVGDTDVDADGLPDDWELFYFQALTYPGAVDVDGDGASNRSEFLAGTDPARAADSLRVVSLARDVSGRAILRVPHAASRTHSVEWTEDFSRWTPLIHAPIYDLAAGIALWTDDLSEGAKRFYRAQAMPVQP